MHRPRLLGVLILLVILLVACSGGDDDSAGAPEPAETATETEEPDTLGEEPSGEGAGAPAPAPLPGKATVDGTLKAGKYHTSAFQPTALFKVGRGWETRFEQPDSLVLLLEPEPNDQAIYLDSSQADLSVDEVLRFVKQTFIGTTGERRNFRFSGQASAPTGVADGEGYTMEVLADQPVVTFGLGTESYEVKPGDKLHVRAIDAGGSTILIFIEASGDEFDSFRPKAEKVLSTLRFQI
jgi:hypothetical protein